MSGLWLNAAPANLDTKCTGMLKRLLRSVLARLPLPPPVLMAKPRVVVPRRIEARLACDRDVDRLLLNPDIFACQSTLDYVALCCAGYLPLRFCEPT